MPLYEYRCRACGHVMEVLQKHTDPPKRKCEKCAGRVEKLVSRSAFQLKGGGWYAEGYGKPASKKSDSSDGGGKKSESKSDSGSTSSSGGTTKKAAAG